MNQKNLITYGLLALGLYLLLQPKKEDKPETEDNSGPLSDGEATPYETSSEGGVVMPL